MAGVDQNPHLTLLLAVILRIRQGTVGVQPAVSLDLQNAVNESPTFFRPATQAPAPAQDGSAYYSRVVAQGRRDLPREMSEMCNHSMRRRNNGSEERTAGAD